MDPEKWLEQHDQMMADFDMRMSRLQTSQEKTEKVLRTAIRLAVQDARRQRRRNAEFDNLHLKAEAEMGELRQLMKVFLERGGNGKH
jgi:hypothetical protein